MKILEFLLQPWKDTKKEHLNVLFTFLTVLVIIVGGLHTSSTIKYSSRCSAAVLKYDSELHRFQMENDLYLNDDYFKLLLFVIQTENVSDETILAARTHIWDDANRTRYEYLRRSDERDRLLYCGTTWESTPMMLLYSQIVLGLVMLVVAFKIIHRTKP